MLRILAFVFGRSLASNSSSASTTCRVATRRCIETTRFTCLVVRQQRRPRLICTLSRLSKLPPGGEKQQHACNTNDQNHFFYRTISALLRDNPRSKRYENKRLVCVCFLFPSPSLLPSCHPAPSLASLLLAVARLKYVKYVDPRNETVKHARRLNLIEGEAKVPILGHVPSSGHSYCFGP